MAARVKRVPAHRLRTSHSKIAWSPPCRVAGAVRLSHRTVPGRGRSLIHWRASPMNAPVFSGSSPSLLDALHARFLALVPRIELHGRVYFRHVKCPQKRADAIAEMVALCWKWFVRLALQGKDASQFPSALARFAACAVHSGRRLCGQEKSKDVLSPVAQ